MKNEPVEDPKKLSDFYDKDHNYKKITKTFRVACDWSVYGIMEIEANSLKEAVEIAEDYSLPTDTEYIDGSFEINEDITQHFYEQDHKGK